MAGLAKANIIGNLGKEPELRYTSNGKPVTQFSVAVNRKQGEQEITDWYNIQCWGKLAEVIGPLLHKGSKVYVDGRLQIRQYETQDGRKGTSVEIVAADIQLLDKKEQDQGVDDDMPF